MPTIAKFLGVARNSASKIGGVDYFSLGKMTGVQNFDPDAKAYIQRVEGASGDNQILEIGVRYAINDFVVGCKDDGNWNAIKASCIMAGARTVAGALQPLVGTAPTNFNFVAGNYDRKSGLIGDGSTKYLNSNRANDADPQNIAHKSVYRTVWSGINSCLIGAEGTNLTNSDYIGNTGFTRIRSTTGTAFPGGTLGTGFIGMNRSSSASYVVRGNTTNYTINVASGSPVDSSSVLVFRRGSASFPFYSSDRIAFYSIGAALDLALLDARVTALIDAFGTVIP